MWFVMETPLNLMSHTCGMAALEVTRGKELGKEYTETTSTNTYELSFG